MSTRIYQAFYRDDQLPLLDSEFTPYDNRANPVANLYEHYIYHQTAKLSKHDGIKMWGTVSWQWKNKLHGVSAQQLIDKINGDSNADVFIFNPFMHDEAVSFNVWEQGQWCHPYILHLGRKLLELMGEDPSLVEKPMTRETYLAANYFVGNEKFWDGLLDFLDRFVEAIPQLNDADAALLRSSAGYGPNGALDHSGFICERLISTYLISRNDLRINSWAPSGDYLSDLKLKAVTTSSRELLREWDNARPAKGPKLATQWIEKLY